MMCRKYNEQAKALEQKLKAAVPLLDWHVQDYHERLNERSMGKLLIAEEALSSFTVVLTLKIQDEIMIVGKDVPLDALASAGNENWPVRLMAYDIAPIIALSMAYWRPKSAA